MGKISPSKYCIRKGSSVHDCTTVGNHYAGLNMYERKETREQCSKRKRLEIKEHPKDDVKDAHFEILPKEILMYLLTV